MALWVIILLTCVLAWFIWSVLKNRKKDEFKTIPGPRGLPFFGNIFQMTRIFNKQMSVWSKEYGKIYKTSMGSATTVVISDPKWAKEIMSDPAATGRISIPSFDLYQDTPGLGIFSSDGERWEVHRRFLLRHLRDFGLGKSTMETLILEEVKETIERFKKMVGKPVKEIRQDLTIAMVNSLWSIVSSQRFAHDDPELVQLTRNLSTSFTEVSEKGMAVFVFPWLKHIIPEMSGYNAIRRVVEDTKRFLEKGVEQHKRNFKEGELNDFIDLYLDEMEKAKDDQSSTFHGVVGERNLVAILSDLFSAGSDSTATTLAWAVLYLCKWQDVQKKLQREIEEVTGNLGRVTLNLKAKMPYVMALIDEILRFSSIVPDGVPHRLTKDKEFKGYLIQKDSYIQINIRYVHFNEEIWGDPETFRPERFLTDGKRNKMNEYLLPFQVGRRECIGQGLARDTIFLFLTNLCQEFNMEFDPNDKEPGLEPEPGFLMAPAKFSFIMSSRN